ncbi:MAG: discoidin domain-containing protein, partial [Bacteroidota bacterium]
NNPLPTNYFSNPAQNVFLDMGAQHGSSSNGGSVAAATDGNSGSKSVISASNGLAVFTLDFPVGQAVSLTSMRAKANADILIYVHEGGDALLIGTYSTSSSYQVKRFLHTGATIDKITLESNSSFDLFEIAAMSDDPTEYVTLDLGSVKNLGSIKTRHWAGSGVATATQLLVSTNGEVWTQVASLNPNETSEKTTTFSVAVSARYVRVAHKLVIADWKKVYVWEIDAFEFTGGAGGTNGPAPIIGGVGSGGYANSGGGWVPHAGYVTSYVDDRYVMVSSDQGTTYELARDKNEQTQWVSGSPLPNAFIERNDLNAFAGLAGQIGSSSSTNWVQQATDQNGGSAVDVQPVGGSAWFSLDFNTPMNLLAVSLKAKANAPIQIYQVKSNGDSTLLGTYATNQSYQFKKYILGSQTTSRITLSSTQGFQLFEIGGLDEYPTEYYMVDLGTPQEIGTIITRHWSYESDVQGIDFQVSSDGTNWNTVAEVIPSAQGIITTCLNPLQQTQYFRIKYTLTLKDYAKAFLWEFDLYDRHGKYGPPPSPQVSPTSLRDMLGVNTIWGWGHNEYSDLRNAGEGAELHQAYASHARYYHNMNWDIADPDQSIDFDAMENGQGTAAQWWLDWNREYEPVTNLGMILHNTIQFDHMDPNSWTNPYQAGYNYGYAYASYFGPTNGNGLVQSIEVGNEPWYYPNGKYHQILQGMAQGIKAADAAIQILPCAMQATDPSVDLINGKLNYVGSKLSHSNSNLVD